MKRITSAQNEYIKKITKLTSKKHREEQGLFVAEGEHLIEMLINSDYVIDSIVMSDGYFEKNSSDFDDKTVVVPDSIFEKISDTKSPQGVMALVRIPENTYSLECGRYIYCDNLQDPGNVGTIIRTADAFSFDGVILSKGSADVYSSKVIRSAQGSVFNIKVITDADITLLKEAKAKGFSITSTALSGESVDVKSMKSANAHIFVIGNEGSGVTAEILSMSDEIAHIKMSGKAESLNAAVAASILMYEVSCRE